MYFIMYCHKHSQPPFIASLVIAFHGYYLHCYQFFVIRLYTYLSIISLPDLSSINIALYVLCLLLKIS